MPLTIGVVREQTPGERRVALVPDQVTTLGAAGLRVLVEEGAGRGAWLTDEAYSAAGAEVVPADDDAILRADLLVSVARPAPALLRRLKPGQAVLGLLGALGEPEFARSLAEQGVTAISLDGVPRTLSRAQPMDALTSQANVAGYKAVLVAANAFARYFPMLFTAAGTVRPARVLVLGAGVAGLQAIGTARRLGAVVSAYDLRPEACTDAASVGATVLDLGGGEAEPAKSTDGYARALAEEAQRRQRSALAAHVARHDIVITTAQVPGRRPPSLVDEEAVKGMSAGSVIVDLAAGPLGGNVSGSRPGETVVTGNGVTIIGAGNLPSELPVAASAAYSRNVTAVLTHLVRDAELAIDPNDEIQAGIVITHDGAVIHPMIAGLLAPAGPAPAPSGPAPGAPSPGAPDGTTPKAAMAIVPAPGDPAGSAAGGTTGGTAGGTTGGGTADGTGGAAGSRGQGAIDG